MKKEGLTMKNTKSILKLVVLAMLIALGVVISPTPLWTRAWTKYGQTPISAQKRNSLISERIP